MTDKTVLYLEAKSGISGDMTVAALLDLGVDRDYFIKALDSLGLDGVSYGISPADKNGITACSFDVVLENGHHHHHEHHHEHEHHLHSHEHEHEHEHHLHSHEHRNLADVFAVIDRGVLTEGAKTLAKRIFTIVAEAESKVHGKGINEVHFHEVGALDSIIDIVGAAVCIDFLGIEETVVSALSEGSGFVECQHGTLPVPVPATAEIAMKYNLPLTITSCPHEMVTPTGIAIAAALKNRDKLPENFIISKTGYGAGKRDLENPNILRAFLGREKKENSSDQIWVMETNIDDSTGEQLGLAMEALLAKGALDVYYTPVFMKKNRPGWMLGLIAVQKDIPVLEETVFKLTTTIGIRRHPCERTVLKREKQTVRLDTGIVEVKKCSFEDNTFYYPEYESVKKLSSETGIDFMTLYAAAQKAAEENG